MIVFNEKMFFNQSEFKSMLLLNLWHNNNYHNTMDTYKQ